jgi:6-phosphogluconolactonase
MKRNLFLLFIAIAGRLQAQTYYLMVGTYDSPNSEGIYVYKFNSRDGSTKAISHVKTGNPSYLAISPDKKYVYAVNENADSSGKGGRVTSFSFNNKTGKLTQLSQQSSGGNNPCYITIDKTGNWVLAGNYSSGNFSVLPVKNGILGKAKKTVQHQGFGPDTTRQESPHVHGIFMKKNNTGFYVTDLGIDKLMQYNFQSTSGAVSAATPPSVDLSSGSGPRHLEFHPRLPLIYVINELSGTIDVLKKETHTGFAVVQNITAFPPYFRGKAGSADIHVSPDGKFLYCSNRGTLNNISIFSVDKISGYLTFHVDQPSLGAKPRHFNFDPTGKFLLVANQDSDEIVIFRRDTGTGLLTDTGNRVKVGKPVCIKWMSVK